MLYMRLEQSADSVMVILTRTDNFKTISVSAASHYSIQNSCLCHNTKATAMVNDQLHRDSRLKVDADNVIECHCTVYTTRWNTCSNDRENMHINRFLKGDPVNDTVQFIKDTQLTNRRSNNFWRHVLYKYASIAKLNMNCEAISVIRQWSARLSTVKYMPHRKME